jgi:hypothetical protein
VSCPEGTEVTGGGYELREVNADTHTLMDAPNDNGWKVSIKTGHINEDGFLTVYAICGALGEIPVEICDDGIDNDGDMLVDTADPDCAEPPPPRDTDSDGVRDTTDNCDNVPNPGQEDADSDGIGDACDETPFPIEVCTNFTDDDGDGLADIDDPDCEGVEWFRFELSNCQFGDAPRVISCDAEQTEPLPPTYDSLGCRVSPGVTCSLGRIDGGFDAAVCQFNSLESPETAVCFVEPDD